MLEALCALAMVIVSAMLYKVSRAQRRISDQQREIMANQLSLNFELERGRLYCNDMKIVNGRLVLVFENTGRLQLETDRIEFRIRENRKVLSVTDSRFDNSAIEGFRVFVHNGKPYKHVCMNESFRAYTAENFPQELLVEFRAYYTTLGERRLYTWGWVLKRGASSITNEITGNRYVGPRFERDEPCPATVGDSAGHAPANL